MPRALPHRAGERNERLFYLARSLKGVVVDDAGLAALYDIVRAWWKLALPVIRTKDWRTTWSDFRRSWSAVAVPVTASQPIRAMRAAAASAGTPSEKLLSVCRALAGDRGRPFHLSARTAGDAIGVSHMTASRLLNRHVDEGHLVRVRPGCQSPRVRSAAYFRLGTGLGPPTRAARDEPGGAVTEAGNGRRQRPRGGTLAAVR